MKTSADEEHPDVQPERLADRVVALLRVADERLPHVVRAEERVPDLGAARGQQEPGHQRGQHDDRAGRGHRRGPAAASAAEQPRPAAGRRANVFAARPRYRTRPVRAARRRDAGVDAQPLLRELVQRAVASSSWPAPGSRRRPAGCPWRTPSRSARRSWGTGRPRPSP